MFAPLKGRSFLSMADLNQEELLAVLNTAHELKNDRSKHPHLHRKGLAMIFQKPSLRTRASFERGMAELGGQAVYLAPTDISLGKRETTEDIALVLSRFYQLIMARVFGHDIVIELAKYATVPVINGLSDHEHPCQALADYMTIQERKGDLKGLHLAYIGDGNNVAHSLMLGGALLGVHVTVVCPPLHEPDAAVLAQSKELAKATGAEMLVSHDMEAIEGADILYTDVWTSMGQEKEANRRRNLFKGYCIDAAAMEKAKDDAIILHCLPAHYGEEIDYETSRLPNSAIFDQAENRMHAQKALMVHLAG
jgi:ornithine carbamoyltransferase